MLACHGAIRQGADEPQINTTIATHPLRAWESGLETEPRHLRSETWSQDDAWKSLVFLGCCLLQSGSPYVQYSPLPATSSLTPRAGLRSFLEVLGRSLHGLKTTNRPFRAMCMFDPFFVTERAGHASCRSPQVVLPFQVCSVIPRSGSALII